LVAVLRMTRGVSPPPCATSLDSCEKTPTLDQESSSPFWVQNRPFLSSYIPEYLFAYTLSRSVTGIFTNHCVSYSENHRNDLAEIRSVCEAVR
jgi:hypothetical protein